MIKCVSCGKELELQENQNYIFCPKCGTKNIVDETNLLTNNNNQDTSEELSKNTDSINVKRKTDESSKNAIKVGILAFLLKYLRFIIAGLFLIITIPIWLHYAFNGPKTDNTEKVQVISASDTTKNTETTKESGDTDKVNTTKTEPVNTTSDNNEPKIKVKVFVEVEKNLLFSKYDVDLYFNGKKAGTIKHGTSSNFEFDVYGGTYGISFKNVNDESVYHSVSLKIDSNTDVFYRIKCESNKVTATPYKYDIQRDLKENEVRIDFSKNDLISTDISSVVSKLKQKGFTRIYEVDEKDLEYTSSYNYHKVISVTINSSDTYASGSIFKKDDIIIVKYHEVKQKTEQTTPVTTSETTSQSETTTSSSGHRIYYHSSFDRDIAKQGNSGIYSYRSRGGSYYIYYIVDFDHGYVYRFRNDEDTGMAAKIVSGDLNSYVLLRYKDSSGTWENAVHFKYKNLPDTLILQDDDGFETTFYETDLSEAVKIYKTKTVYDYSPK